MKNNIQNDIKNKKINNINICFKLNLKLQYTLYIILIFIGLSKYSYSDNIDNYNYLFDNSSSNIYDLILYVNSNWQIDERFKTKPIGKELVFGYKNILSYTGFSLPNDSIKTGVSFYDNINEKSTHKIFPIYVSQWIYSPKLGRYYKLAGFGFGPNTGEDMIGFDYSFFIDNDYTKSRKNLKESPFNMLYFDGSLISNSFRRNSFYKFKWFAILGSNCYFDARRKEKKVKCYNELDLSDYERYLFYGTSSEEERNAYIKFYNVKPLSSYYISKEDAKENKESWILSENKKEKRKILIMVPKDQAKYFIKVIKRLPDNALDNLIGYVWFMSEDIPNNKTGYKINYKRYDTKPNDKYDAELSRISGGKLKAKYGRYLTKERYSEDYVAPSIYGNNYNDKPDW